MLLSSYLKRTRVETRMRNAINQSLNDSIIIAHFYLSSPRCLQIPEVDGKEQGPMQGHRSIGPSRNRSMLQIIWRKFPCLFGRETPLMSLCPIQQQLPPPSSPKPILASFFPVNAPNGIYAISTEGSFPGKLPLTLAERATRSLPPHIIQATYLSYLVLPLPCPQPKSLRPYASRARNLFDTPEPTAIARTTIMSIIL